MEFKKRRRVYLEIINVHLVEVYKDFGGLLIVSLFSKIFSQFILKQLFYILFLVLKFSAYGSFSQFFSYILFRSTAFKMIKKLIRKIIMKLNQNVFFNKQK